MEGTAHTGDLGSFPLPSQIEDVPGAENWRSMYPYFTRFQPEDDNRFWFYNAMHFPEPMPAFDVMTAEIPYTAIGANTARVFVFPTTLGIEHRIVNGRIYITAIPVTDPAEIERRLAIFQRAGRLLLRELGPALPGLEDQDGRADRRDRGDQGTRSCPSSTTRPWSSSPPAWRRTTTCARTTTAAWTSSRRCGTTTPSS